MKKILILLLLFPVVVLSQVRVVNPKADYIVLDGDTIEGIDVINWNTAYGWGNHASAGYLIEESDPLWFTDKPSYYTAHQVLALPVSTFSNDVHYLTSFTETDPVYSGDPAAGITATDILNWDSAYNRQAIWDNNAGILQPVNSATEINISTSQSPVLSLYNTGGAEYNYPIFTTKKTSTLGISSASVLYKQNVFGDIGGGNITAAQILVKGAESWVTTKYHGTKYSISTIKNRTNSLSVAFEIDGNQDVNIANGLLISDSIVVGTEGITLVDIQNWNTAFGWGNHASAGYLTSTYWTASGDDIYNNNDDNVNIQGICTATQAHESDTIRSVSDNTALIIEGKGSGSVRIEDALTCTGIGTIQSSLYAKSYFSSEGSVSYKFRKITGDIGTSASYPASDDHYIMWDSLMYNRTATLLNGNAINRHLVLINKDDDKTIGFTGDIDADAGSYTLPAGYTVELIWDETYDMWYIIEITIN